MKNLYMSLIIVAGFVMANQAFAFAGTHEDQQAQGSEDAISSSGSQHQSKSMDNMKGSTNSQH